MKQLNPRPGLVGSHPPSTAPWVLLGLMVGGIVFVFPFGFGEGNVRFSDAVAIFSGSLALLVALTRPELTGIRLTFPLIFLFLFLAYEIISPLIGVVVWADQAYASSTFRALVYWVPVALVALLLPRTVERVEIENKVWWGLVIAIILNAAIACVEYSVYQGWLSADLNPRRLMDSWAVDAPYFYNRIWSAGTFVNSTQLASFSFIALSFFSGRALRNVGSSSLNWIFLVIAFVLIVLTTSRVAMAATIVVIVFVLVRKTRSVLSAAKLSLLPGLSLMGVWIVTQVELEIMDRYARLLGGGLSEDFSWSKRVNELWSDSLAYGAEVGHPLFVNPSYLVGTIDSGYITYYLQGGVVGVGLALMLPLSLFFSGLYLAGSKATRGWVADLSCFLPIYVLLAMVVTNPLRNPVVIAAMVILIMAGAKVPRSVPRQVKINRPPASMQAQPTRKRNA